MLILDKLWNGEVFPAEREMGRSPDYKECLRQADRAREALVGSLTPEQQALLETYGDWVVDLAAFAERDAFFAGCRLGGMLLADILLPA